MKPLSGLNQTIYLDHNATTPLHPAVKSRMDEYALLPLNPSSIHSSGRAAKSILENSRKFIAKLMGFESNFRNYQITFTSGGTEANNIIMSNYKDGEIFISATEHLSILAYSKLFSNFTVIQVDRNGILDLDDLQQKLAS
jgi:cysteine desulfurase